MSEHEWVQENLASYSADGLEPEERDRVSAHVPHCAECRSALEELRGFDQKLGSLFATARPTPAIEDRMIQSLRAKSQPRWLPHWIVATGAAVILLGCVGALAENVIRGGVSVAPFERKHAWVNDARKPLSGEEDKVAAAPVSRSEKWVDSYKEQASPNRRYLFETTSLKDVLQIAKEEADKNAAELLNSVGYYPPSQALVVNGSSRMHSRLGGEGPAPPVADRDSKDSPTTAGGTNAAREGKTRGEQLAFRPFGFINQFASRDYHTEVDRRSTGEISEKKESSKQVAGAKDSAIRKPEKAPAESEKVLTGAIETQTGSLLFGAGVVTQKSVAPQNAPPHGEPTTLSRKVIRSGDIEFEVQSFDSAVAVITKLINDIKGGFVATINSDKLANGKVKGAVVVRVPPEALDTLLLDLRRDLGKLGELKGMKVGSQDITKQYTDLESRLRAAVTMQERLLQMIKDGKGAIKDLLQAEKELGVWRTKIEELEGEIRYYNNLVSLSTLTINLYEKEIKAPFGVIETERIQMGLEVDDVEKAHKQVLAAVAEAKGRITKSELKQHASDQLAAIVNFEVAPEAAGSLRDRLRQLGNVARLESDRLQETEGGTGRPQDGKTKRNDTQFFVSLFNLTGFTPRETTTVQMAARNVPAAYRSLQEAVARLRGRVVNLQFNEQDRQNITAQVDFDVRRADEPAVNAELGKVGDVFSRSVTRAADSETVLDSKVRLLVAIIGQSKIPPRETTILGIEVPNVDTTAERLAAQVSEAKGRTVESNIAHERSGRVTAKLVYDVPLSAAAGLVARFRETGIVRVQKSSRNEQVPESSLSIARIDVTLSNSELIVPSDEGIWPHVRKGLSTSVTALSWSLTVVIIGVCFVLPWAIVIYAAYRIALRFRRTRAASAA